MVDRLSGHRPLKQKGRLKMDNQSKIAPVAMIDTVQPRGIKTATFALG
jgi:hypothetical protein